jgi:hypothetical protein
MFTLLNPFPEELIENPSLGSFKEVGSPGRIHIVSFLNPSLLTLVSLAARPHGVWYKKNANAEELQLHSFAAFPSLSWSVHI